MKNTSNKNISRKTTIFIVLAYLFLTIILTIPITFQINTHIVGAHDNFETYSHTYNHYRKINLGEESPLEEFKITKVTDISKYFKFSTYVKIIHLFLSEPLSYNIIWLSAFFFSALGAFWLCFYFTKNVSASFLGGLIYAFSPLHFGYSLAFGGGTHIEFIPFFVLFFFKYLNSLKIKPLIISALFLIFILTNEPHYAAYTILFILITLSYFFYKKKLYLNKKFIKQLASISILVITALIIIYWPLLKVTFSKNNYLNPGIQEATYFSNDLVALITPGFLQPWWGNFFQNSIMEHFTGNASEWSIYIGLTGLFFLLFSFFIRKKYKNLKFWLFVFLFFFIISLGPFLHVLGTIKPKIPLPYLFIYHYIPFFKNIRSVGRAFIYASLSISIISAFGFSYIFQKLKNKQTLLKICFLIFFSIIIIDFWAVPNTTSVEIPEIYHQMAKDKSDYKILLPTIDISHGVGSMSKYYKTLHGKDYVAGFHFARENPELFKKANRTPVVNNLIYALPYGRPTNSFIEQDIPLISNKTLNENNIKYIILNKQFIGKDITLDNWVKIRNFIEDNIKVKKVINDNHGLAYKVLPSKNNDIVILQKNNGWTDTRLLNTGEFVADASENNPSLLINNYSANNKNIALTLNIRSSQPNRKISLKLNNNEIKNFDLSQKRSIIKTLIENIKPGENRLDFILKDSLGQKIEISEHDTFTLSLNYKESKNFSYPQYYDDLARIISDNNVIQTPLIIYDSKNNNISKNNILRLNTLEQDEACSCLKIDDYSNFDSLKETIATKDINYQRINSQLCLKKYNIKYIIINKEFLSANEYSNMISYIAYSIPYKELIHNDNKLQIYQILEPDSKNKTWISNFEKNNINEWDNFYGSFNDITITKDSHTGKHSAQINFQPGQNFNGLIKLFNTPKIEASVEGWIKVKNWSEGFVSIYFDFIKNKDHFYKPKLIVNDSFYLPYHYTGHLYHNNEKINFPHNLPNEKWIKMKLEIKNSHLYVYQDEKEILKINNYVHSPLYGFRLGVGGCCPESNIQMLIDDFKITY